MILFYDTETTGLPDFKARSDDPVQPHIVQLAMALHLESGDEVWSHSVLVRPEGWTISAEMTAIHGISQERALREGIAEVDAVGLFVVNQAKAELRVAHNEAFDRRIMRIAMVRAGIARDMIEMIEGRHSECTCIQAKPILKMPPTNKQLAAGFNTYKAPKLTECIQHFFGEQLPGAHDAMVDVRACARIYFQMRDVQK